MNIFTTDHPLSPEPVRPNPRNRRRLLFLLISYPVYLILVGPFWALDGRHHLDFIPERIRFACYLPTFPIWFIPHVRGRYADYMDWWYLDPNSADRETGWD
ncbi:hypothetical protein Cflav_PD6282 [Pedosphaera parvula Ellin514]|uniref:Uncharacterized protein n=1 Tax=Pedosphaera parvula (strain Ellin514) TaxID=320771 RepID=B9XD61_PEDPL|nr:hypothetical protein Cflav_PD6282 [Pedosphaera parvula Ellin514]